MSNNNYEILENKIEEILRILDELSNLSQSNLSSEKLPLIDRFYFWHIFDFSITQFFALSDLLDQVKALKERDVKNRKEYLLTK